MNRLQKVIFAFGTALIALNLLFPPWNYIWGPHSDRITAHAGYQFLFDPPPPDAGIRVHVNVLLLAVQTVLLFSVKMSVVLWLDRETRPRLSTSRAER